MSGAVSRLVDRLSGSYSAQLALTLAAVVIVLAGVGWLTVVATGDVVERSVEDTLVSQAESESANVERWLETNREFARVASEHPALRDGNRSEATRYLSDIDDEDAPGAVVGIHLVDRDDGDVVASGDGPGVPPPRVSDIGFFSRYDDTTITDPYERDGRRVVAFASPVGAAVDHVLVVVVATDSIGELFQDPYGDGVTTIVDSAGVVRFSDASNATGSPYLTGDDRTSTVVARGTAGETGFDSSFDREAAMGDDYVRAYAPVAGTDWVVVKHARTENAYAVVGEVRRGVVGFVAAAVVGSVVVVGFFGWQTGRTVRRLADAAESVAGGDYDTDVTVDRDDEFGTLGQSLDEMRDELVARLDATRDAERRLRTILNNVPTTLLAFDADGTVTVEEGRRAGDLFDGDVVGDSVFDLLADRPELLESCRTALDGEPVETSTEALGRTFDVRFKPVGDDVEQVLVVAHDVTERRTRRQRIEVLNRVLRHDVRNRLNVVVGHAEAIQERADDAADAESARIIAAEAHRVLDLSEKARGTQAVVDTDPRPVPVDELVAHGVARASEEFPSLTVETALTPSWARGTEQLSDAVAELLVEAATRGGGAVRARVTVEHLEDTVLVRVDDDGQPLPAAERRALEAGSESPLEHTSGVGLWLAYWTVTLRGGEFEFADSDLGGTCVELRFERATPPDEADPATVRDA